MRMASTTLPTSLEQDSMTTLSVRSICISCFRVSSPFNSGISTSRMMKSGRSPASILEIASCPDTTVSTSYPSTSSRVPRYFRMLGSSSTTSIRSFSAIGPAFILPNLTGLTIVYRQQERKSTSPPRFTIHPNLAAMRLHQPLGNRQAKAHSRRGAIHAHKVLEDLLMMFGGNSRTGIRNGNLDAIGRLHAFAAAVQSLQFLGRTPLPEVKFRAQVHMAARGRVFQRVIQQIGNRLLHFLIVEFENRQVAIQRCIQANLFAHERFAPARRQLAQAIAQIV